ncbi:RNA polymerase sigma factor, partial [Persicitalea sp.]|uniref:RNA polymerase sigma factor n=1 Tax=Persicitalea sp. TaxID=3100273 RepID=UPI0035945122
MANSTQHTESQTQHPAFRQALFDEQYCWDRFRLGDEAAFTKIAEHYYRHLLHYGLKFTPNQQTVEDALQDLLIHLWLHRATIQSTPSVKFYLMKAFRRQVFKSLKRSPTSQSAEWQDESLTDGLSVEDAFIQIEQEEDVRATFDTLLNALPARQREVLYLRFYQELSTEEIA